jgi:hypothetical protein
LKNFSKDFDRNRETTGVFRSTKHKFGEFNWALGAKVRWNPIENEYFLAPYLRCESVDQSKFPICAYSKTSILNQERDSMKMYSKGKNIF